MIIKPPIQDSIPKVDTVYKILDYSQEDLIKITESANNLYQDFFTNYVVIAGLIILVVTIILPLLLNYLNKKDFRELQEGTQNKIREFEEKFEQIIKENNDLKIKVNNMINGLGDDIVNRLEDSLEKNNKELEKIEKNYEIKSKENSEAIKNEARAELYLLSGEFYEFKKENYIAFNYYINSLYLYLNFDNNLNFNKLIDKLKHLDINFPNHKLEQSYKFSPHYWNKDQYLEKVFQKLKDKPQQHEINNLIVTTIKSIEDKSNHIS